MRKGKTMVDVKKRTTLKVLSGAAVIATTPSIVYADCIHGPQQASESVAEDIIAPISHSTELTIALSVDPEPTVTLTNNSDKVLIVRHVYPGIMHAGKQTFDINSIFENGAYGIAAGKSRTAKIVPTISTQAEMQYPRHLYRNKPQRTVAVTGSDQQGPRVNSTRSFYS